VGKEGGDARARAELDRVCLNLRKSGETVYYSEDGEVELKKRKNSIRKIFAEEKLKSSSISNLVALRLLLSFFPKSRKQCVRLHQIPNSRNHNDRQEHLLSNPFTGDRKREVQTRQREETVFPEPKHEPAFFKGCRIQGSLRLVL